MIKPGNDGVTQPVRQDVLTVVDSSMQRRISLALQNVAFPVHLDSVEAALEVAPHQSVQVVLVHPASVAGKLPEIRKLSALWSGRLVAVIDERTPVRPETLLAFGGFGIRTVIDLSARDGWDRLRELVSQPELETATRIHNALRPSLAQVSGEMGSFVEHLIRVAPSTRSMREVCKGLRILPSTLMSRFFRERLPSPKKYLATMRQIYVAAVLEDPRASFAVAANRLNYSSPQSLGRHLHEQFRINASEFRQEISFTYLTDHFADQFLHRFKQPLQTFQPVVREFDLRYRSD